MRPDGLSVDDMMATGMSAASHTCKRGTPSIIASGVDGDCSACIMRSTTSGDAPDATHDAVCPLLDTT